MSKNSKSNESGMGCALVLMLLIVWIKVGVFV